VKTSPKKVYIAANSKGINTHLGILGLMHEVNKEGNREASTNQDQLLWAK